MQTNSQIRIFGNKYFHNNLPEQCLIVLKSSTTGYYHVIVDNAFQNNKYYHLTLGQLREKFGIYTDPANERIKTLNDLLRFVTDEYHVSLEGIKAKGTAREYAEPRQVYCYFAKELWPKTILKVIGAVVNRSYDTVLYSVKIIKQDMKSYKDFRQEVEKMWDKINPKLEQPSNES